MYLRSSCRQGFPGTLATNRVEHRRYSVQTVLCEQQVWWGYQAEAIVGSLTRKLLYSQFSIIGSASNAPCQLPFSPVFLQSLVPLPHCLSLSSVAGTAFLAGNKEQPRDPVRACQLSLAAPTLVACSYQQSWRTMVPITFHVA